jgi:hypothetical protein
MPSLARITLMTPVVIKMIGRHEGTHPAFFAPKVRRKRLENAPHSPTILPAKRLAIWGATGAICLPKCLAFGWQKRVFAQHFAHHFLTRFEEFALSPKAEVMV